MSNFESVRLVVMESKCLAFDADYQCTDRDCVVRAVRAGDRCGIGSRADVFVSMVVAEGLKSRL